MLKCLRSIVKRAAIALLSVFARFLYPRENMRGRWFEQHTIGWRWVWQSILWQKVLGFNRHCRWPVNPFNIVGPVENISFDIDDLNNFHMFGCYFQCFDARIVIGSGTYIAPNVGLITSNHNPMNPHEHRPGQDIIIGKSCWIGMNSVVLPGVHLGDHTVVGAGSVVTRSFPEGNCILAGAPARLIKDMAIVNAGVVGNATAADDSASPVQVPVIH